MKKFKHLFAALAIVLVALSVSGCGKDMRAWQHLVSVELYLSNPSGRIIHCEYSLKHFIETLDDNGKDIGKYELVNDNSVALVYFVAKGLHTNYNSTKEIRNQASGSVDFELDDETDYVQVEVRVLMTDDSTYSQKIYERSSTIKIDK